MRAIDGFTQIVVDEYSDRLDEEGRGYLQRVRAAAHRMEELIDIILDLSRVGRQELDRSSVDLSSVAESVANGLREDQP
ncbi:histidine kinase dimerization/phospho-acceptor domain-containing protein, partial [Pontibacterium sp.]|uniref:histidine kinase dimerization/phospho-acceptor domain-containing protein n=1 Tax=Pontibacterium sp. TaxID=2036026 RepID=UPI003561BFB4